MKYLIKSIFLVSLMELSISAAAYDFHRLDINDTVMQKNDLCSNCHVTATDMNSNINWTQPKDSIDGTINNYYDNFGTPDSFSKACLLCHDGSKASLALNAPLSPCGIKGKNTSRGHPIFVNYTIKNDLHNPSTLLGEVWRDAKTVGDLLRDNKIVCISCHLAHNGEGAGYLRTYSTNSMLCLGCHNK